MAEQEYIDLLKLADIKIKSYLQIGNIAFPIIVDIAKIKDDKNYKTEDSSIYYKSYFLFRPILPWELINSSDNHKIL